MSNLSAVILSVRNRKRIVKQKKLIHPVLLFVFSLCFCFGIELGYGQDVPVEVERLTVRPIDTIDAERIRIWIPIEGGYSCGVKVHIYDSTGKEVRYFLNTLLSRGYHNFYWDKRDSLGNYVAPGTYSYESKACGRIRTGKLDVVFTPWERDIKITTLDSTKPPTFVIETKRDSIRISLSVLFAGGRVADEVVKDSLFASGVHSFMWTPKMNLPPNLYRLQLQAGEYVTETAFRYQP